MFKPPEPINYQFKVVLLNVSRKVSETKEKFISSSLKAQRRISYHNAKKKIRLFNQSRATENLSFLTLFYLFSVVYLLSDNNNYLKFKEILTV